MCLTHSDAALGLLFIGTLVEMFGVFLGHATLAFGRTRLSRGICSVTFRCAHARTVRTRRLAVSVLVIVRSISRLMPRQALGPGRTGRLDRLVGIAGEHLGIIVGFFLGRLVFNRGDLLAVRQQTVRFLVVIIQGFSHRGNRDLGPQRHIQSIINAAVGRSGTSLGPFTQPLGQISRILRGIALIKMFDHSIRQPRIDVIHRSLTEVHGEPVGKMLKQPDSFGVHAGSRQIHDFGDAIAAIGAGSFDVRQVHIGAHMHAQWIGDAVHHLTHAERSSAGPQIQHANAHNNARLGRDTGIHHRLIPVTRNVFHVQRNRVGVEFSYGRCAFRLRRIFFLLFAHVVHYYSPPTPAAIA